MEVLGSACSISEGLLVGLPVGVGAAAGSSLGCDNPGFSLCVLGRLLLIVEVVANRTRLLSGTPSGVGTASLLIGGFACAVSFGGVFGTPLFPFSAANPALICHWELNRSCCVTEKLLSNWTWNCGLTRPVVRSRISATFLPCCGDLPR